MQREPNPISRDVSNPWNTENPFNYGGMWLSSQPIIRSMSEKVTGEPQKGWEQFVLERYLWPALENWDSYAAPETKCHRYRHRIIKARGDYRCLILGSNEGNMERMVRSWGFTGEIIASDIADKALQRASSEAARLGYRNIRHVQADLNETIPDGQFDFIIAEGVLHHIKDLDKCFSMIEDSLTEQGLLIASEFVGPFRFQLPPQQVVWINTALRMLPRGMRLPRSDHDPLTLMGPAENETYRYSPPTEDVVIAFDPTEALSGHALNTSLLERFEAIQVAKCGGTITTYLQGLVDYERSNEPLYAPWMDLLIDVETTLIDDGILDSDYVFYVVKKRSAGQLVLSDELDAQRRP